MTTDRTVAEITIEKESVTLLRAYLNDEITKDEFEKRKRRLELKVPVKKTHTATNVPDEVKTAVKVMNGSAILQSEHGCPPEKL